MTQFYKNSIQKMSDVYVDRDQCVHSSKMALLVDSNLNNITKDTLFDHMKTCSLCQSEYQKEAKKLLKLKKSIPVLAMTAESIEELEVELSELIKKFEKDQFRRKLSILTSKVAKVKDLENVIAEVFVAKNMFFALVFAVILLTVFKN